MANTPKKSLTNYLAEWPHWGAGLTETPTLIKQLTGGTSNYSYLINISQTDKTKQKKWVLRIHKANLLFKTDREHEDTIQKVATQLKLAPAILYQHPYGDYQICEYIVGASAAKRLPLSEALIEQLCHYLKQLHQAKFDIAKSKISTYLYSDHINRYWRFLLQQHSYHKLPSDQISDQDNQQYQTMLEQSLSYEKRYGQQRVLCHHDLNSENILLTPDRPNAISILDWEFAGAGIASMDFACLAFELNIDINEMSDFSGVDREQLDTALQIYRYTCQIYNRALAHTVHNQHDPI